MNDTTNPFVMMESRVARGQQLAESKWSGQVSKLEGLDKSFTALVLENTSQWMAGMEETVRAVNVGS